MVLQQMQGAQRGLQEDGVLVITTCLNLTSEALYVYDVLARPVGYCSSVSARGLGFELVSPRYRQRKLCLRLLCGFKTYGRAWWRPLCRIHTVKREWKMVFVQ